MSDQQHPSERQKRMRIHIDGTLHESPNPTTGEAIYRLGHVETGLELYREVTGDREDPPIEDGPEIIHLREDEHFHSGPAKEITIIVNGRQKKVASKMFTFAQVVALAYNPVRTEPGVLYTVSYIWTGQGNRRVGFAQNLFAGGARRRG